MVFQKVENPICNKCGEVLTEKNFNFSGRKNTGLICKNCFNKKNREWRKNNREKSRESNRKSHSKPSYKHRKRELYYQSTYGISINEYDKTLLNQNDKCVICGYMKILNHRNHLYIDYDHKTNKVRGILCDNCNKGLGHFKDSVDIMKHAIKYLQENGND